MVERLHINLSFEPGSPKEQVFEITIPVPMLYAGFKVSYLATEEIEELIFDLIKNHVPLLHRSDVKSDSLEELLLSLETTEFTVRRGPLQLRVDYNSA
jgi:hypothetical protein